MAKLVFTEAQVTVAGVDFTDHVDSVEIELEGDEQDCTNFASSGWTEVTGGIKSWSVTINFQQDYAASEVDATLFAAFNTVVAISVVPTSAAVSATNPNYNGNVLVNDYKPVAAQVGELGELSVSWPGDGAPARSTS